MPPIDDQETCREGAVGHRRSSCRRLRWPPLAVLRRWPGGREVGVLRNGGLQGEARLAMRQRRQQEAEDTAGGRELHQRGAVLALARDDDDQLREMLSELRDHGGHVGRAGGIGDQYAGLQVREFLGDMVQIGRMGDRRAARGGLLDGLHQIRVTAQDQNRRLVAFLGSSTLTHVLSVVDFEIDLVLTALEATNDSAAHWP